MKESAKGRFFEKEKIPTLLGLVPDGGDNTSTHTNIHGHRDCRSVTAVTRPSINHVTWWQIASTSRPCLGDEASYKHYTNIGPLSLTSGIPGSGHGSGKQQINIWVKISKNAYLWTFHNKEISLTLYEFLTVVYVWYTSLSSSETILNTQLHTFYTLCTVHIDLKFTIPQACVAISGNICELQVWNMSQTWQTLQFFCHLNPLW